MWKTGEGWKKFKEMTRGFEMKEGGAQKFCVFNWNLKKKGFGIFA